MTEAVAYLRERTPAEIVTGALGPRMRALGATLADGVLLNTVTPDLARAAAAEIRAQATAASRPVPGVYVNVMAGVGTAQIAELGESAAFLKQLPGYAAHFRRARPGYECASKIRQVVVACAYRVPSGPVISPEAVATRRPALIT